MRGPQELVSSAWLSLVAKEETLTRASDLYQGRAFGLAKSAASRVNGDLGIISAGLGYVRSDTQIPSYDLTVRSSGPGSVVNRINGMFDSRSWWESVGEGPYSAKLASEGASRPLVLVCLSRAYSEMVAADLIKIAESSPNSLRIFGLSISDALPPALKQYVLPYDERLERMGRPGTRVDFPQRALTDYLESVAPATGIDLGEEVVLVLRRLAAVPPPTPRQQRRIDDETLRRLIVDLVPTLGTNCTRMLAHVRRQEGYSCEQRRFSALFKEACKGVST